MQIIDFNSDFKGFGNQEDVLLDTGILLALFNKYDGWFTTVNNLFEKHIFGNDNALFLYVNPCIVNETTYLAKEPFKNYLKSHRSEIFTQSDANALTDSIINEIDYLIKNEILLVLDGNKETVIKQISLCKYLGDADALNLSIANEYGTSFLTIDNRLVNNASEVKEKLENIKNIYFTNPSFRDYR